ncbi:MAG: NAD(+)/NADH kinase [Dehalococcoidales bacterium]|nr:NAD(+)/NADH kinase [Dehalococcoidales bacterium]MDD3264435.1 NAD(+)/NADH kinase [Dehalococcoidales bacterium]MDD4321975.1 NAD(+)/NADH kinase [Dehalococcoidales bacterium]MDD4794736.1 NAD(+)/NADH kinase [Dehalococcoidales bacterium]MDD5122624.1 NAD(+)/NADH kinase [Dehalococcoidales bacterium]
MKTVGVVYHPKNQAAPFVAEKTVALLKDLGMETWLVSAWDGEEVRRKAHGTELIITVGGDGTILRTANAIIPGSTCITGINLGRLGFLTEVSAEDTGEKIPALVRGEGWIDERTLLQAELALPGADTDAPRQQFTALNDIVVARGEVARIIHVETRINGDLLTTFRADGVILATATGSTGYALAAGGPVMHPASEDFLLIPILPHLGLNYNMVLPADSEVQLQISNTHTAALNVDGHTSCSLPDGSSIAIRRSPEKIRFLRTLPKTPFYSTIEKRLKV